MLVTEIDAAPPPTHTTITLSLNMDSQQYGRRQKACVKRGGVPAESMMMLNSPRACRCAGQHYVMHSRRSAYTMCSEQLLTCSGVSPQRSLACQLTFVRRSMPLSARASAISCSAPTSPVADRGYEAPTSKKGVWE